MDRSTTEEFHCPFCGEMCVVELDLAETTTTVTMIEDCQNCCKPVQLSITYSREGVPSVEATPGT